MHVLLEGIGCRRSRRQLLHNDHFSILVLLRDYIDGFSGFVISASVIFVLLFVETFGPRKLVCYYYKFFCNIRIKFQVGIAGT